MIHHEVQLHIPGKLYVIADREKIFERFYRSKFNDNISFSGFGIGLYISAEIIRRHEGTFGVTSSEVKGSTFYFTLPVKK